jgi:predicted DNA-binding protein YlxM (UPF0122 family)
MLITSEVAAALSCTKQNIDDLIKRNKLTPLKEYPKCKLFFSGDVQRRFIQ